LSLHREPQPLYEDSNLALLKSHYYGGIKKYHWVNNPLALHGVIFTKKGKQITISIGEKENEPKFIIPDLLPHLAQEQYKKPAPKIIEGEELNILVGSIPVNDDTIKDGIKLAVLEHLNKEYGLVEEDFFTAELELVPAGKPFDIGLDKGLIGAYGQDDGVCVYTSLQAIIEITKPKSFQKLQLLLSKWFVVLLAVVLLSSYFFLKFPVLALLISLFSLFHLNEYPVAFYLE